MGFRGFQCWFCNRRFAKKGEHPTYWVEFFCQKPDCLEADWPWKQ
jgi:hypothetical protein